MSEPLTMAGHGIRVCFCDLKGRPHDDWDAHEGFCLMLDWALANGKITPGYFERLLGGATADLGITQDEISAEAETMPRNWWNDAVDAFAGLHNPRYSPFRNRYRPERVTLPGACYKSEYGFMVHIRGTCRCPR